MASQIPENECGVVLELGAGTGNVTAALLKRGITPQQLRVVERSEKFARHLRKRFPELAIIEGDAQHLSELLNGDTGRVATVVSSLPMRSLPADIVTEISAQMCRVLAPGGKVIQFTYGHSRARPSLPAQFVRTYSDTVWGNIPPARVEVYQLAAGEN